MSAYNNIKWHLHVAQNRLEFISLGHICFLPQFLSIHTFLLKIMLAVKARKRNQIFTKKKKNERSLKRFCCILAQKINVSCIYVEFSCSQKRSKRKFLPLSSIQFQFLKVLLLLLGNMSAFVCLLFELLFFRFFSIQVCLVKFGKRASGTVSNNNNKQQKAKRNTKIQHYLKTFRIAILYGF